MSSDPTRTRISASAMPRIARCQASAYLSEVLESIPSADSERGDRIHAWLEALAKYEFRLQVMRNCQIPDDDLEVAKTLRDRAWAASDSIFGTNEVCAPIIEERLFAGICGETISGRPDLVLSSPVCSHMLILDYKTGWGEYDSSQSEQLETLVALVAENFFASKIYVAAITPRGEVKIAEYNRERMQQAHANVTGWVEAAQKGKDAAINPGNHCQYCPAFQHRRCDVAISAGLEISERAIRPDGVKTKEELAHNAKALTADQLGAAAKRIKLARMVCDAIEDEAKDRLERGEEVPGCSLVPGKKRREIPAIRNAYETLKNHSRVDAFFIAAKLSVPTLEKALKGSGITLEALGVEESQNAPSLKVQ